MICLRIPPFTSRQDLRRDTALPPLLVRLLCDLLRYRLLLVVVIEDAASVLGAYIRPLSVGGGRVMHFVEVLDDVVVGELLRVVD